MLENIPLLKDALIEAFYPLYDQYNEDQIYACALVFNEYLRMDDLAVSTTRSLFAEHEDPLQYLSEQDKWQVTKWRYRSHASAENRFAQFKLILADYFKKIHAFGHPMLEHNHGNTQNNLDLVIAAFQQAKQAFVHSYGLDTHNILFFIHIPQQPQVAIHSAQCLNSGSPLLDDFIQHHSPKTLPQHLSGKQKLYQADKDLLVDLAQMTEIEPYDYLHIAQHAYLLTLESAFIDSNPYIQKLIQTIAAMDCGIKDGCALEKNEILERIQQFYHASQNLTLSNPNHFSDIP